jgi:cell division protein FtsL
MRRSRGQVSWRWRAALWYGAALILVVLAVMGYLWPRHQIVALGYELEQAEARRLELRRLHRMLSLEAASLASLERIERIATGQLKMVFPKPGQVRTVHNGAEEDSPP